MSMTREEIDLREKIAEEIKKEMANLKLDSDTEWAFNRAQGIVRQPIYHSAQCPCSICKPSEVVSCSDNCSDIRKLLPDEHQRLESAIAHSYGSLFFCGYCRNGQNEWHTYEMLYDITNEIAVTPCCHTEATEALSCYCPEDQCEAEDKHDQRKEDEASYRYSVLGR